MADVGEVTTRARNAANLADGSTSIRYNAVTFASEIFTEYPLIGVGAGNFGSVPLDARLESALEGRPRPRFATSVFFDLLAELGIVGITVVFMFFASIFVGIGWTLKQLGKHTPLGLMATAVGAALAVEFVLGFLITSANGWYSFRAWSLYAIAGAWATHVWYQAQQAERSEPLRADPADQSDEMPVM